MTQYSTVTLTSCQSNNPQLCQDKHHLPDNNLKLLHFSCSPSADAADAPPPGFW